MKRNLTRAFKLAFPYTIPIFTGFLFLGFAYGVYMRSLGFSPLYPMIMCFAIFAGSLEFLAGNILLGAFNPLQAFLVGFAVNARHIFYGLSLLDKYKNAGKKKLYMIYALCDETFSVNVTLNDIEGVDKEDVYFAVTLLNQGYWVFGTYLGALFGGVLSINTQGLDFVMTALFIVIFLDYYFKNKQAFSSAMGFILSIASLLIFGKDNFIIPAMVSIVVILLAFRGKYDIDP